MQVSLVGVTVPGAWPITAASGVCISRELELGVEPGFALRYSSVQDAVSSPADQTLRAVAPLKITMEEYSKVPPRQSSERLSL